MAHVKIVSTVQISRVLQFIWHYIVVRLKRCDFFASPSIVMYAVSHKNKRPNSCLRLCQILTDFRNAFAELFLKKFAINRLSCRMIDLSDL